MIPLQRETILLYVMFFILGVIGVLFGLFALIYAVPFLLFYVLPFVAFSFLLGASWTWVCQYPEPDYGRLILVFPLAFIVIKVVFGFPETTAFHPPMAFVPQSPWLFESFRFISNRSMDNLPEGLSSALDYNRTYDWGNLARIAWVSLSIGGPAVFMWFKQQTVRNYKFFLDEQREEERQSNKRVLERAKEDAYQKASELSVALSRSEEEQSRLATHNQALAAELEKAKKLLTFEKKPEEKAAPPAKKPAYYDFFGKSE
jgi:hypothetical protein